MFESNDFFATPLILFLQNPTQMAGKIELAGSRDAAQAAGRCYGALFFSAFGAVWLLLAAYAFASLTTVIACLIATVTVSLVATAMRLLKRSKSAQEESYPENEKRRSDRSFGIVNAVTWFSVFLVFQILPRLGYEDLAIPAAAFIVGLHFFPMPPLYRHRANLVAGAVIMLWAILCVQLFQGDSRIGFVAFGSGITLWVAAVWALLTAVKLLRSLGI